MSVRELRHRLARRLAPWVWDLYNERCEEQVDAEEDALSARKSRDNWKRRAELLQDALAATTGNPAVPDHLVQAGVITKRPLEGSWRAMGDLASHVQAVDPDNT